MEEDEHGGRFVLRQLSSVGGPGLLAQPSGSLPDELIRRLSVYDPAANEGASTSGRLSVRLFCQERHEAGDGASAGDTRGTGRSLMVVNKWRQKEKLKTTAVALVLCLNIGVDPPDVVKISPCARLECWVDPLSMQPAKALETIGKNLQAQYERWQPRAKYKMHLDPTLDDVKKLAASCRRTAKQERVLFHYNGHGVPRPTVNGEIWVFNSRYTQYIPLSIYELQAWLGTPAIYVLDCSAAGLIINSLKALMDARTSGTSTAGGATGGGMYTGSGSGSPGGGGIDPMREIIVLAACGANELLPQNPDLPADVFTACLTTPIKVALRWFCSRSLLRHDGLTKELIDRIPGRQTDRKTPLGELNWIFTAITDTIAWNSLPRATFQKLFRQDLLVASLFRNFLLAERILAAANATPVSWPRLPPTHQHPMWQAWDMAAEMCLLQLPALLADPAAEFTPSTFFSEQLTAFELWLAHGSADKKPPEQLPIVLQVLLSQVHRLRALVLLGRFLDMGLWAVDLALSVGIFPYVLKLLQTTSSDLRTTLVFIWAKILALDTSCQADLVKDGGHLYFLKYLDAPEPGIDHHSRAQAVFVLATVCDGHPRGQALCYQANLLGSLLRWLQLLLPGLAALEAQQAAAAASGGMAGVGPGVSRGAALLVKWCCLALGRLVEDAPEAAAAAMRDGAPELLSSLLGALDPELRAAAVFALGCLIHSQPRVGPGGAAAADSRFSQLGVSMASSSSASLATQGLGSSAALGAAGAGAGSAASLAGTGGDPAGGASTAAAAALLEASINAEQSIAALLLRANVVYDASALVRSELAVALARLVRGHMPLLEDAIQQLRESVSYQQRKVTELLRAYQRQAAVPQHMPDGAQASDSAMAANSGGSSGSIGGGGSGGSGGSGGGPQGASSSRHHLQQQGHGQQQQGQQLGSAGTGGFHSTITGWAGGAAGGGLYVPDGSSVAAAAAAAGVGGGPGSQTTVYSLLLETVLALATDPSPRVARLGRRVLGLAQMELAPLVVGSVPAPQVQRSTSGPGPGLSPSSSVGGSLGIGSAGAAGYGGAGSMPGASVGSTGSAGVGASLGSLTSKLVKGGRSWRSGFASGATAGGGGGAGVGGSAARLPGPPAPAAALGSSASIPGSAGGSPPGSPTSRDTASAAAAAAAQATGFARRQYILRSTAPEQQHLDGPEGGLSRLSSGAPSGVGGGDDGGGLSPHGGGAGASGGVRGSQPSSTVYAASCEYFSRPMLEPQASAWRELEAHKVAPWMALQDGTRKAQRLREMEAARTRCRGATNPRLREQVSSIETGAESLTSLVFHSFHLLLVTADQRGYVRVQNAADGSMLNTFHVTNGSAPGDPAVTPSSLVYLRQLNEAESNLLLTCAADGAVRVWRSYLHNGNQRLAAAWQAVPMRQPAAPVPWNASFALADATRQYWLYAAGGSHPDVLQRWDLHSEMCAQQIAVRSSSSGSSCPVAIEHLSVSQNDPHLLLAGCSDQMLRLFDVRAGATPALSVHAGRAPLAGMVLEPCGRSGAALTGSATGELRFLDLRLAAGEGGGDGGSSCVVRSVQAHSTGGMSVLAAHPNAPLLATATAASASVVKVWTDTGDLVGAIKSAAPQRMAPVTAMAWHPYNLYLGAGGKDSVASVFIVDHVPPPVGSVGGQAAAAVSPGSQPSSVGLPPQPPQYSAGTAGSAGSGQQPQHSQQAQQQAQQQHGGAPSSPSVAAAGAHAGS